MNREFRNTLQPRTNHSLGISRKPHLSKAFKHVFSEHNVPRFLRYQFAGLFALMALIEVVLTPLHGSSTLVSELVKPSSDPPPHPELIKSDDSTTLAFPGAEGFGALARGGRGGRLLEVTNLYDNGPGSLRAALEADGPRTVVFRVAGTIMLKDTIRISHPYLTVAGQTAPAGGITLRGNDNSLLSIRSDAHDIIIRYLKLRNGSGIADGNGHDNLTINSGHDIIIDHVSMSWSSDENLSIWRNPNMPRIFNITVQNSIMAEGLEGHSNGMIISGRTHQDPSGKWLTEWSDINNISIHHNLFINNTHRNPRVTTWGTEVINNVVYNWKYKVGEITRGSVIDVVGNYLKPGPMSIRDRLFIYNDPSLFQSNEPRFFPSIYTQDNLLAVGTEELVDNWTLWSRTETFKPLPHNYRRLQSLPAAPVPVNQQSAAAAYESVLANAGANARLDCDGRWIQEIDAVDERLLNQVKNDTGPSGPHPSPAAAGGYPEISAGQPCTDQDQDGIPDRWETLHGLNPRDPKDAPQEMIPGGYTQLEAYLNGAISQPLINDSRNKKDS